MHRQFWRFYFWLLVGSCCWQACLPVPQKSPRESTQEVQALDFEYLKLTATVHYYNATKRPCRSGYVKLRLQKDRCIWFTLSGPWGIEVMRGMITPAGVVLLYHMQKAYAVYDYTTLRSLWPGPWDYPSIQALLLGELTQAYTAQEVVQKHDQQAVIQQQKGVWRLEHTVNLALGKVEQLVATASQGTIVATYSKFKPRPGGLLFGQAKLSWYDHLAATMPARSVKLTKVKAQWPKKALKFPFAIPAHYEEK